MKSKPVTDPNIKFICNVCGIRAPEPILCARDNCLTRLLVYGVAAVSKS